MISLLQAAVLFLLTVTDHVNIGILVGLTAFQGIVVAFNQPARLALVPSLVPPADIGSAVAINSVVFNLARFIGPIFAGFAIVGSGVSAAFAANAGTYAIFLVALARIRIDPSEAIEPRRHSSFLADLVEGIRYTATHPGIAALLLHAGRLRHRRAARSTSCCRALPAMSITQAPAGCRCSPHRSAPVRSSAACGLASASTTAGLTWIALGTDADCCARRDCGHRDNESLALGARRGGVRVRHVDGRHRHPDADPGCH